MARSPQAKVHLTTGQGVSRRAYQTAYSLGNHGSGSEFRASVKAPSSKREYGKLDTKSNFNVSYGDTVEPGTLDDINQIARKPKRGR